MVIIGSIYGCEILDSRGSPTVEVEMELGDDAFARASAPSGASTGRLKAVELRDGDESRYLGKGVQKAVAVVNETIVLEIIGMGSLDQHAIDQAVINLNDTPNKGKLGASTILGVSLVTTHASTTSLDQQLSACLDGPNAHVLPVPVIDILNGGSHTDPNVGIQEFMVAPLGAASFKEVPRVGAEVYHALKGMLKDKGLATDLGDEGGFAPNPDSNAEALDLIVDAISKASYQPDRDAALALDVAPSEFFKDGRYQFEGEGRDTDFMVRYYEKLIAKYPTVSIEDPLSEEEWEAWKQLTAEIGDRVQLVGDGLFVTNPERLKRGIGNHVANALLAKVNQIDSLIETLDAVEMARHTRYHPMTSHYSGETGDTTTAHLVVTANAGQIKIGAPARTEHVARYNELFRIRGLFKEAAVYASRDALPRFPA